MERIFKKLLIGFFISMLLFTIVSRAAASVIVPQVRVNSIKKSTLSFELSGTGTVKENSLKSVPLISGYKISSILKQPGDTVEKGDILFTYDIASLEEKQKSLSEELTKLNLQYQKTELYTIHSKSIIDKEIALQEIQNAKEDLIQEKDARKNIKTTVIKNKQDAYNEAADTLTSLMADKEDDLNSLKRAATDAKNALAELEKPSQELNDELDAYQNAVQLRKEDQIALHYNKLFDLYYHETYKDHQLKVGEAEKELVRAKEDLEDIKVKWEESINIWDQYSSDDSVKEAYKQQVLARDLEIKEGNRAIADASDTLNILKEDDLKLSSALYSYRIDIENNNTTHVTVSYQALYQLIYENLDIKKEDVDLAELRVSRAEEDTQKEILKWNQKIEKAQANTDKLYQELQAMKNGSYDYTDDLKDADKVVESAKRALEAANLQLDKLKENESATQKNDLIEEKSTKLDLDSLSLDINNKQSEINEVTALLNEKGKVPAPTSGIVSTSDLDYGITLTGGEKFILATGGYELIMKAAKDQVKYFSVGDEIEMKTFNSNDSMVSQIETMGIPDNDGIVTFTSLLEKGSYKEGDSLEYKLNKKSDEFGQCIPAEAIREDSMNRTFVLLVKNKDSVLGKEQTAFRMDVTVIDMDMKTAAIEGSLTMDDLIIIDSNKEVTEGDRVRINETE